MKQTDAEWEAMDLGIYQHALYLKRELIKMEREGLMTRQQVRELERRLKEKMPQCRALEYRNKP